MKKGFKLIVCLLVLFVGIFSLTACNNKEENATNTANDGKGNIYLLLNTDGLGQVAYYIDDIRQIDFDDEYPSQQAYIRLKEETKATIKAKANEGYKFVKWTKNNKDYSTDSELEITIKDATELTAIFTIEE